MVDRALLASRRFILSACVLFGAALCQAAAHEASGTTKHAYISGENDPGIVDFFDPRTVAYDVEDGHLVSPPARIYPGTAGPIAFDTAGKLYASEFQCRIAVYSVNSLHVERRIELDTPEGCGNDYFHYTNITALAVDRAGYVYVSMFLWAPGSDHPRPRRRSSMVACTDLYSACTAVYPPGASGLTPPLQIIDANLFSSGLAIDSSGHLYLQDVDNQITVIANPTTNPKQARTIMPAGLFSASHPLIDGGLLYVQAATCQHGGEGACKPGVAVFPESAKGVVKPDRLITLPIEAKWWNIAITGDGLYAGAGGPVLEAFDKRSSGATMPLFTTLLAPVPTFPQYLVFGP